MKRTLSHWSLYVSQLVVVLLFFGPRPALGEEENLDQILAELTVNPTIEEVQRAALEEAALEPQRIRSLLTRIRWAGLLPRVEASLSRGYARDEDIDRNYQEWDELELATDQDLEFRVSLRWDLDRLVFDPEELRARREAAYQTQRRRELLLVVTRLYFELLMLRASERCDGASEEGVDLGRTLRMAEIEALLDGLTGGLLSREAEEGTPSGS